MSSGTQSRNKAKNDEFVRLALKRWPKSEAKKPHPELFHEFTEELREMRVMLYVAREHYGIYRYLEGR
jgi:hypothetical protein